MGAGGIALAHYFVGPPLLATSFALLAAASAFTQPLRLPRTGFCRASSDEGCFRAHDAEFVALGIGENGPGLVASLADIDTAGAQPQ